MIGGTLLGGGISALGNIWGANTAADAQTNMQQQAIGNQNAMMTKLQSILQPFITGGSNALSSLQGFTDYSNENSPLHALMRLVMPGADMTKELEQTPGYQFNLSQGLRATNNALAARGLGGSGGAVAKGAANFASGLAGNTWSNIVDKLSGVFGSGVNALQGMVNTGTDAGGKLAGVGQNTANQISSSLTGIGNAQGGAATATGNAVGGLGNSFSTAALLQRLLGNSGPGGGGGSGGGAYGGG